LLQAAEKPSWKKTALATASQQNHRADVHYGSKADIGARPINVRFTPQKQTLELSRGMSALCQKRARAPQQKNPARTTFAVLSPA